MSHAHHSYHHVDHNVNFAIFTGWSNLLLNPIVAHVLSAQAIAWVYVLGGTMAAPFIVACTLARTGGGGSSNGDGSGSLRLSK
jgi:hypothetical protein